VPGGTQGQAAGPTLRLLVLLLESAGEVVIREDLLRRDPRAAWLPPAFSVDAEVPPPAIHAAARGLSSLWRRSFPHGHSGRDVESDLEVIAVTGHGAGYAVRLAFNLAAVAAFERSHVVDVAVRAPEFGLDKDRLAARSIRRQRFGGEQRERGAREQENGHPTAARGPSSPSQVRRLEPIRPIGLTSIRPTSPRTRFGMGRRR
jgi:hypothetical protein